MELYIRSERDQMKKIIYKILIVILLISSCIGTINVEPVTVNAATKTNWPKGPSIYEMCIRDRIRIMQFLLLLKR